MGLFRRAGESFLPDRDYVPLAIPTTDLGLLWVLTRSGDAFQRYGLLTDLLNAPTPLPADAYRLAEPLADAGGTASATARAGVFARVVLDGLGGATGADLSATGAHTVEYSYTDLTSDAVHLSKLDAWLAGADYATAAARSGLDLLLGERLYAVVSLLMAAGAATTMRDARGAAAAVDASAVQDLVGAGVEVSGSTERSSVLRFRGRQRRLVIAAKVVQVRSDPGGFYVETQPPGGSEIRGFGAAYLRDGELLLL